MFWQSPMMTKKEIPYGAGDLMISSDLELMLILRITSSQLKFLSSLTRIDLIFRRSQQDKSIHLFTSKNLMLKKYQWGTDFIRLVMIRDQVKIITEGSLRMNLKSKTTLQEFLSLTTFY